MIALITWPYRTAQTLFGRLFPNHLYLMWVPEFSYCQRVKFGISNSVPDRRRQIAAETGLTVRVALSFPLPFAKTFEQGLLYATRKIRAKMPNHAGQTEWRKFWNIGTAALSYLFLWAYGVDGRAVIGMGILFAPIPIDAAVLWLLVVLLDYAFIAALVSAGGFILQMI